MNVDSCHAVSAFIYRTSKTRHAFLWVVDPCRYALMLRCAYRIVKRSGESELMAWAYEGTRCKTKVVHQAKL